MSDRDDNDELIKNPDTRTRRDWVDRAITGVRRRLDLERLPPETTPAPEPAERPHLYVVPSSRKR